MSNLIPEIIEDSIELLPGFTRADIVDLRESIDPTKKLTWSQIKVFLQLCTQVNLDPRRKHIYPIPRWNNKTNRMELTTVTSIDGFRLVAERTGRYAPGQATYFLRDDKGFLQGATVFVKKMTVDGTWHEVSETAFLCEYMPKNPGAFWGKMPSVMIAKVAEVRALRRAFPDTFSGIYGEEEMHQADKQDATLSISKEDPIISDETWKNLDDYVNGYDDLRDKLKKLCKVDDLRDIKESQIDACRKFSRSYVEKKNDEKISD